jgi:hypothetical protein
MRFGAILAGAAFGLGLMAAPMAGQAATPSKPHLSTQDYIDIYQLYAAYAYALDTGNGPARAAVFVPDGVFRSNQSNEQPVTIPDMAKKTTETGNVGDRHLQYNIMITPTAEGADGQCYVLIVRGALGKDGAFRASPEMYKDSLVKTKAGWRFKTRQVWSDSSPESPYFPKKK